MSNKNKTIYDFDFSLIYEYFASLERQGPGSSEVTIKALSFIDNLTDRSHIADLGCGTGGQTMVLGQHAPGQITGLELSSDFIRIFNHNAAQVGLQDKVKGIVGSMDNLPFRKESLDLIWSEGAIYNIGFERGLKKWHEYLKTSGYIAVTEASWFTEERPSEIHDFWMLHYPEIDTIAAKVTHIQRAGYIPVATFILPEDCWTKHYFVPGMTAQKKLLAKYPGNKGVEEFIAAQRHEAALYDKYKEFYGYVFYIGKKI
ncbi:MAG: class I SAM-dependent methyltransferase [Candidatus Azobacteroides sp.]|nr:class I SAM-dependent methyltransferase [Candidatus Azobacteroides sp.]